MTNPTMTTRQLMELPVNVPVIATGAAIGLSRNGIYQLLREGRFPIRTVKVGRQTFVPKAELLRFLGMAEE